MGDTFSSVLGEEVVFFLGKVADFLDFLGEDFWWSVFGEVEAILGVDKLISGFV